MSASDVERRLVELGCELGSSPAPLGHYVRAVRTGAQAGLVALLIVNMTFTFNGLGVTSLIGLLVGLSAASRARPGVRARSRAPQPSPLLGYR